jgi:predicted RND superfamily exporter protein
MTDTIEHLADKNLPVFRDSDKTKYSVEMMQHLNSVRKMSSSEFIAKMTEVKKQLEAMQELTAENSSDDLRNQIRAYFTLAIVEKTLSKSEAIEKQKQTEAENEKLRKEIAELRASKQKKQ